ncbi:MAG: hypothetical protein CUN55_11020 [Phototrophicales bacterium]|nr:MAG: hypothetical protein CUN55_11020 [Phototrophicales bacterium]
MLILSLCGSPSIRNNIAQVAKAMGATIVFLDEKEEDIVAHVAEARPAIFLIELQEDFVDWQHIIWSLKTNPATRRLGIIGVAAQYLSPIFQRAKDLLINDVVLLDDTEKQRQQLKTAILEHARPSDLQLQSLLKETSPQRLPPLAIKGLQEFNAQQYYEAHETLEAAWVEESGPMRDLYRGILQIAVAYYHILRGNYRGAQKMFLRSLQWLEPLPDVWCGINIAKFREDVHQARQHLETLGPDKISDYDKRLLKPIEFNLQES